MTALVSRLDLPPRETRDAIDAGPTSPDAFRAAFAELGCLDQIELVPPPASSEKPLESARILFWNAERLKYLAPSTALFRRENADAVLLCEVDLGMARSGNRHTAAELAGAIGAGYVFAVEFVEFGLGDEREQAWHAGQTNDAGLHGGAIVSPRVLQNPRLVRLENSGRWFDGTFGQRRVGSRIAVTAELTVGGVPVLLVSLHYESHTDPVDRLAQTRLLLDAIDRDAPGRPVLLGGDFNTNTMNRADSGRARHIAAALKEDPDRLILPMRYEPMFAELAARGYDWKSCNVMGEKTQRTRPDGTPPEPLGRIDWFFSRGLECSDPAVIPAVDEKGAAISDHEVLAVTIRPAKS